MTDAIAKIPPTLAGELLKREADGAKPPALVAWLIEVHHVTVTVRDVRSALKRWKRLHQARGPERAIEASAQAKELARSAIAADLEELAKVRGRVAKYERKAAEKGNYETAISAARAQVGALAVSIRAAGDDELRHKLTELEELVGQGGELED